MVRFGIGVKACPAALAPLRGTFIDVDGASTLHDLSCTVGSMVIRVDRNEYASAPHPFGVIMGLLFRDTAVSEGADDAAGGRSDACPR